MSNIVFLDIETKPDQNLVELFEQNIKPNGRLKDPAKIRADIDAKKKDAIKQMSVDHDFSTVFCVGIKPLGGEARALTFDEFVKWMNEEIEGEGSDGHAAHSSKRPRWKYTKFVTYNGKNFDWPVIIKNGIKSRAELPYAYIAQFCDRYDRTGGHIDLMEKMGLVWGQNKSLDMYLQIYLGIAKKEIDFATCTDTELTDHCLEDLENTEKMFELWNNYLQIV
jgi:hypothetical protein